MDGGSWRILAVALALALAASPARAGHCDFNCKVRVTACRIDAPSRCLTEDKFPETTGLCAYMTTGILAEWIAKNPGFRITGVDCVSPDDQKV